MSNSNSFGGKLRKVLASMCSLFVGASGVSQAIPLGDTSIPTRLKLGKDARLFGFGDFGWKLASGDAKKENSWLVQNYFNRWQRFGMVDDFNFDVGFKCELGLLSFCIWTNNNIVARVSIPKGILFDVMRHFEHKYFPNGDPRDKGTELSCAVGPVSANVENEVFLRFIVWAFCGSDNAIKPNFSASVADLRGAIFKCVVEVDEPDYAGDRFELRNVQDEYEGTEIKFAVLRPGYFLENFNKRVCEVYNDLGYDVTDVVNLIAKFNKEKRDLENQKHIGKYLLGALIGLIGGGALVEGAHRFLSAKRSGSSGKSKDKISSNGKNGQKAKKNLKKQKS